MAIFTTNSGEERTGLISLIVMLILISITISIAILYDTEFLAFLMILIPYTILGIYCTVEEWKREIVPEKEPYDHLLE